MSASWLTLRLTSALMTIGSNFHTYGGYFPWTSSKLTSLLIPQSTVLTSSGNMYLLARHGLESNVKVPGVTSTTCMPSMSFLNSHGAIQLTQAMVEFMLDRSSVHLNSCTLGMNLRIPKRTLLLWSSAFLISSGIMHFVPNILNLREALVPPRMLTTDTWIDFVTVVLGNGNFCQFYSGSSKNVALSPLSESKVNSNPGGILTRITAAMLVGSAGCAIQMVWGFTRSINFKVTFSSTLPDANHYSVVSFDNALVQFCPSSALVSVHLSSTCASTFDISNSSPPQVSKGGLTPGETATKNLAGLVLVRSNLMSPPLGQSCY